MEPSHHLVLFVQYSMSINCFTLNSSGTFASLGLILSIEHKWNLCITLFYVLPELYLYLLEFTTQYTHLCSALTIIQNKWNLFITCSNFIYISRFILTQVDRHYHLSSFTLYFICIIHLFDSAHFGTINSLIYHLFHYALSVHIMQIVQLGTFH